MAKIKILSDSTCDLPKELIEKYDIGILPLYVNLGGEVFKDNGVDVNYHIIYDYVDKTGVLPGTIGVPEEDFRVEFTKWREQGYEVICHFISSDMSCGFQNARIAADGMDGIWLIDSRSLSTGISHLIVNSAIMARQGMEAKDIVKEIENLPPKISASFILDTLDYLKKGGRCSTIAVLGANLFKIKPMIVIEDGRMKVGHKFRGPLKKVLEDYVDMQLAGHDDIRTDRIFITHSGCSSEILNAVSERIKKNINFNEIIFASTGATVTSHCGQNTLGILFLKK
jgi:DegV family protein with EDD domain